MFEALRQRLRNHTYRRQLMVTTVVGVVVLVAAISFVTTWIMAHWLRAGYTNEAVQLTQQFASQSVIAFLVEDPAEAARTLGAVQALSGVAYVALLNKRYEPIAQTGDPVQWDPAQNAVPAYRTARLAGEDTQFWHFVAPVITLPAESPVGQRERKAELLGYIQISVAKAPLMELIRTIVVTSFVVALVIAGVLIAWLARRVTLLTDPLRELAGVMLAAHDGAVDARAALEGPEEARNIGQVFNELMDELAKHRRSLESQVAMRTEELRQARDQAFTAHRYKNEFMAAITHEMRSPLHAITSYVQLTLQELEFLKESATAENLRQHQGVILQEANNLLVRINQILELARVEASRLEVSLKETNIERVLKGVEKTVQPLAAENKNTLMVTHNGLATVLMDEDKLQQILLNVLSNAYKFTRGGEVSMECNCEDGVLSVVVHDSGIGIPQEEQQHVFEPFRQVDMSDSRRYRGTGLGLAITKRYCEVLGGDVALSSREGQGTDVRITLPLGGALGEGQHAR